MALVTELSSLSAARVKTSPSVVTTGRCHVMVGGNIAAMAVDSGPISASKVRSWVTAPVLKDTKATAMAHLRRCRIAVEVLKPVAGQAPIIIPCHRCIAAQSVTLTSIPVWKARAVKVRLPCSVADVKTVIGLKETAIMASVHIWTNAVLKGQPSHAVAKVTNVNAVSIAALDSAT